MDIIDWSLTAIDKIISTRSRGAEEPTCPDRSFAAGYVMDSWGKWRPMCLAPLSVEDVEDVYLFGLMLTGLMLIGFGLGLLYWKLWITANNMALLRVQIKDGTQGVFSQVVVVSRKMDNLFGMAAELTRKLDFYLGRARALGSPV